MATIPSVLAPVIKSFTPTKTYPSFSSIINQYLYPVTYTNAGANTLLASDVIGGLITHTAAGAETDTLPSAALLIPAIQGVTGPNPGSSNLAAGSSIRFFVAAGGAGAITVAVGAGGTLVGSGAVPAADIKEFLLIVTNVGDVNAVGATYTIYSLGAAAV